MRNALYTLLRKWGRLFVYIAFALGAVTVFMLSSSSWRSRPLEETITVDKTRATPHRNVAVSALGELPVADPDIETAGDRVAEAVIYLKRRQNEPALHALEQARAATDRALTRKSSETKVRDQLLATNRQIEVVKELIQKGKLGNATKELMDVNQQLEAVSY